MRKRRIVVLLSGLVAVGLVLAVASSDAPGPPFPVDEPTGDRIDVHGDPLPPCAVARLGTVRDRAGESTADGLAYSRDGKSLRAPFFDDRVAWFDVETGRRERVAPGSRAFVRNPEFTSSVGDRLDALLGRPRRTPPWCRDWLGSVLSAPGTDEYLTASYTVRRGDREGGSRIVAELGRFASSSAISPDGRTLALGGVDDLTVLDLASGVERTLVTLRRALFHDLAFTKDGARVVFLATDPQTAGGDALMVAALEGDATPRRLARPASRSRLCVAPGDTIWIGSKDDGLVVLSLADGSELRRVAPPGREVAALAVSDAGVVAVVFGGVPEAAELHFFDVATAAPLGAAIEDIAWNSIPRIAFAPGGAELAVLNGAGTIDRVEVASATRAGPDRGHRTRVAAIAIAQGGDVVATAEHGGAVRTWDLRTGRPIAAFDVGLSPPVAHTLGLAYVRDGTCLRLVSRRFDPIAAPWIDIDAKTGEEVARGTAFTADAQLSADYFVTLGPVCSTGERMTVWVNAKRSTPATDPPAGVAPSRVFDVSSGLEVRAGHTMSTWGARLSADGRYVASGAGDIEVCALDGGDPPSEIPIGTLRPEVLAVSPDGTHVAAIGVHASAARVFALYACRTGKPVFEVELDAKDWPHGTGVLVWSPDGRVVVTGDFDHSGAAYLWDATNGSLLARAAGHLGSITAAEFTRDGRYLVTASSDTTALVWDVAELLGR